MKMIEVPDSHELIVEGSRRETWIFKPPVTWQHQRTDGGVLAFFLTPEGQVGVSCGVWNKVPYLHASMVRSDGEMPSYADMCLLKEQVFGPRRYAAQVMPPESEHVNIHSKCLHLWGPYSAQDWPLPKFGAGGSI